MCRSPQRRAVHPQRPGHIGARTAGRRRKLQRRLSAEVPADLSLDQLRPVAPLQLDGEPQPVGHRRDDRAVQDVAVHQSVIIGSKAASHTHHDSNRSNRSMIAHS